MEVYRAQLLASFALRMLISLILPVWGVVMIGLGVVWASGWWGGCGVAVLGVGLLLAVGNPLADRALPEL